MASAGLEKELECSICLTLYMDPVTLRCGHNFCRACIDQMLNAQDKSKKYSCPECREGFNERPVLKRNVTLCNVVENVRFNRGDDAEILCTYCIHFSAPAVICCLLCEASLCDNHLRVHNKAPEHVLTDPSSSLENRKCSVHSEILQYYCTDDAASICSSCSLAGEHRGHRVEMLDEESERRKKKNLRNVHKKLIKKRKRTEEKVRSLEELRRKAQEKAAVEAERVTAMFIDIKRWVDDLEKRLLSEIFRWEESQSLSDVIQKMEIKKDELSRKMRHIEEQCNVTDPLTVLQEPDTVDLCDPEEDGGDEATGGHDGSDQVVKLISRISHSLSDLIRGVNVTFYVQDPADILLDVNTAHNDLDISDDLKTATWNVAEICDMVNYPYMLDRFQDYYQVMSGRGFTSGRHYWDVEISGSEVWSVAMCYPSIDRSGDESHIGDNTKSWGLYKDRGYNQYCVIHDKNELELPHQITGDEVRVCLDYEAGLLSFYELGDPIRHIYTFTATFTEPLYAALYIGAGFLTLMGGPDE